MHRLAVLALSAITAAATPQPVVLTIDPAQSSINVQATLITPLGNRTDSDSSSISGAIEIELDDYGNPVSITLIDFLIVVDDDLTLNFNYGFAGSANAVLTDAIASYANPGTPLGPVALSGTAFAFPSVPTVLDGTAVASYSFLLIGSDTVVTDLADLGVFDASIAGDATSDGQTVSIAGAQSFEVSGAVIEGFADIVMSGIATIVASGPAPQNPGCNPADLAPPFGVLDLADISIFVAGFLAQDPIADLAPPAGVFDLADLGAFVSAFIAGCP